HHHAHLEERLDEIRALLGHAVGEFLHSDRLGDDHVAGLLLALDRAAAVRAAIFLLAGTAQRGEATRAGAVVIGQGTIDGELAGLAAIVTPAGAALGPFHLGLRALGGRDRREAARRRRRGSRRGLLGRRCGR